MRKRQGTGPGNGSVENMTRVRSIGPAGISCQSIHLGTFHRTNKCSPSKTGVKDLQDTENLVSLPLYQPYCVTLKGLEVPTPDCVFPGRGYYRAMSVESRERAPAGFWDKIQNWSLDPASLAPVSILFQTGVTLRDTLRGWPSSPGAPPCSSSLPPGQL